MKGTGSLSNNGRIVPFYNNSGSSSGSSSSIISRNIDHVVPTAATAISGAITFATICGLSCATQKCLLDSILAASATNASLLSSSSSSYVTFTHLLNVVAISMGFATVMGGSVVSHWMSRSIHINTTGIRNTRGGFRQSWIEAQNNWESCRLQQRRWFRSARRRPWQATSELWRGIYNNGNYNTSLDSYFERRNIVKLCTVALLSYVLLCRVGGSIGNGNGLFVSLSTSSSSSSPGHPLWRDFARIAPSSYIHVGSFGRKSVSATERYATLSQRARLTAWGRTFGCHTCGFRGMMTGIRQRPWLPQRLTGSLSALKPVLTRPHSFVGDHMPPKSIAVVLQNGQGAQSGKTVAFRMYPQCVSCSQTQGILLSVLSKQRQRVATAGTKAASSKAKGAIVTAVAAAPYRSYFKFHGFRPRLFHLTGSIVALTSIDVLAKPSVSKRSRNQGYYYSITPHRTTSLWTRPWSTFRSQQRTKQFSRRPK